MSPAVPSNLIQPRPADGWRTVGARVAQTRRTNGVEPAHIEETLGIAPDELARLEAGDPVLSMHELKLLADLLDTTTGAWFYSDERPMFRGSGGADNAHAAASLGRELMMQYLALKAACG